MFKYDVTHTLVDDAAHATHVHKYLETHGTL
jgi:hypothetical protein